MRANHGLERGFRRIVIVLSIGLFLWGTYAVALLATDAIRFENRDCAMLSVGIAVGADRAPVGGLLCSSLDRTRIRSTIIVTSARHYQMLEAMAEAVGGRPGWVDVRGR
jgi:hypothetical protein